MTYVAQNMGRLFTLIRIAGGLYLVWIGIKTFLARVPEEGERNGAEKTRPSAVYLSGLLITLSNPKVILFYCGFLPAFVDLRGLAFSEGVTIVLLVMSILSLVMYAYAKLADTLGSLIRTPRGQRTVNRSAGGIMIAAGSLMILKR